MLIIIISNLINIINIHNNHPHLFSLDCYSVASLSYLKQPLKCSLPYFFIIMRYPFFTFGGSVVILMPVCKMEMGKSGWGLLLSHRRNSGWGSSTCSCSTSLSSWGIQLRDRWQLARNTQLPCHTQTNKLNQILYYMSGFNSIVIIFQDIPFIFSSHRIFKIISIMAE